MQIRDLRYNDRISAFAACVDAVQDGSRLRFPLTAFGQPSVNPQIVNSNLCRQATRKAAAH